MTALDLHLLRIWRACLTSESLLGLDDLVVALPGDPTRTRAWVEDRLRAVGEVGGVAMFRWGDVVDALRAGENDEVVDTTGWLSTAEAASRIGVARCTLDAMVARAPPNLPGAPVLVGAGRRRRRWKWDAATLTTWLASFTEWDRSRLSKPARRRRPSANAERDDEVPVNWSAAGRAR